MIKIGNSYVQGRGLIADKGYKKGKIVLDWNPANRYISQEEIDLIPENEKRYVAIYNGKYLLIPEPERYMNHSCNPNTETKNGKDYALKDIEKGEEITGDYEKEGTLLGFKCNCQSSNCRKVIRSQKL